MSKKLPHFGIDPQFKKSIEARYGHAVDLSDMPDEVKMSGKLIELVEPYYYGELDYPLLYDCATIAWNECLREDHDIKTDYTLNNMLLNFTKHRWMIDALKKRKRVLFPNEKRGIKKVAIFNKGNDDISINVVSDLDIEPMVEAVMERLRALK